MIEDAVRRLVLVTPSGGLFGAFADLFAPDPNDPSGGLPQYGFSLFRGWARKDDGYFWAGHHIATAAVFLAVGFAVRLRRRVGRLIWIAPLAILGAVIFDHMMANYMASNRLGIRSSLIDLHEVTLPDWVVSSWNVTFKGHLVGWLLGTGFVVALVVDAGRMRNFERELPVLPSVAACGRAHQWLTTFASVGGRSRRVASSVGEAVVLVVHELAVSMAALGPHWSKTLT